MCLVVTLLEKIKLIFLYGRLYNKYYRTLIHDDIIVNYTVNPDLSINIYMNKDL